MVRSTRPGGGAASTAATGGRRRPRRSTSAMVITAKAVPRSSSMRWRERASASASARSPSWTSITTTPRTRGARARVAATCSSWERLHAMTPSPASATMAPSSAGGAVVWREHRDGGQVEAGEVGDPPSRRRRSRTGRRACPRPPGRSRGARWRTIGRAPTARRTAEEADLGLPRPGARPPPRTSARRSRAGPRRARTPASGRRGSPVPPPTAAGGPRPRARRARARRRAPRGDGSGRLPG